MSRKRYTEEGWKKAPQSVTRCVGTMRDGTRCLKVAEVATNVCDLHGGLAPQVQAAAAKRMLHSAPAAAEALLRAMNDPSVPWGVRVKIMQDVLDRSDVVGKTIYEHHVKVDPAIELLQRLADDPDGFRPREEVQPPSAPLAIESGEVVQDEVVDHVQDAYDEMVDPVPENVTPLNGWADVDQPQPVHRAKPHTPPKHIRDGIGRLPDGAA
ncbi:hypothetical protein ACIRN4_23830 [Pimelobacter simplex]|uniref:hypothetical protein n=1 Tax=Nocardioides simplex TaxID=2045 RepID=UPI00380649EE